MPSPLAPVASIGALVQPALASPGPGGRPDAFQAVLSDAIGRVESFRRDASNSVESFLAGERQELHQVALDVQRAELAFEMFLQVRNKVVQAYQEVMRMQM